MDKLPTHTTQILATLPEDLDLEKTAEIADKISDAATISSVNAPTLRDTPREDEFNKLQQQINRLSEQIDHLYRERLSSAHNLYKSQRRSRSSSRGRNDVYCSTIANLDRQRENAPNRAISNNNRLLPHARRRETPFPTAHEDGVYCWDRKCQASILRQR
ncbi:unnamed protein product [Acanthosepion pharaonis]|uniref:Uncharacterized protein n=1 Tax=Acanthosepion pharaonis TaxID=158019 RepID=A0A812B0S6_ACAPH|nr:unnamed protein product [Sepia pharaonis]